jgi:predicted MFS family arabinose efflux permease
MTRARLARKPVDSLRGDGPIEHAPPDIASAASLPHRLVLLFAVACGLSVANIYFAFPLLDAMAHDFSIEPAAIGMVVTMTQIGYALGLILIVPLGDLLDRRLLIVSQAALSALALVAVGLAPTAFVLMAGMIVVGLLAVAVQVLVAFGASLARPAERGRVVGSVTSGTVIGILLARFVSGVLADLGGWRSVYLCSAVLMLAMAGLLLRMLPHHPRASAAPPYLKLIASLVTLFREEPILRTRATLAFLIFAGFNVLWAPLALALASPPLSLSHSEIGSFGLAALAGALAAGRAGRLADRGLAQWTTGISLALMLVAWLPIALLHNSLWALAVGVVLFDFAIQAVHVTSQSLIFAVRPEARSRLVAGYMVFYSIGSASGAITSTSVYAAAGWAGVCGLGTAIALLALLFWAATSRPARVPSSSLGSPDQTCGQFPRRSS